jgi:hypothetical protein
MDEACNTYAEHEKYTQNFGRKTLREENSEDPGVDGRITIEWILGK